MNENHKPPKEYIKSKIEPYGTLREDDTRVKLFDPQLESSGWHEENIRRNFYISKGKIIIEGDKTTRAEARFADYVLFHQGAFPIAVIEAKREYRGPADGISQAKEYAERLNLRFAYSTNGHNIEEFDFSTNIQKSIDRFPSPEELYERWQKIIEQNLPDFRSLPINPLTYPLHYDPRKSPYYYQLVAIRKVIEAILTDKKRVLLTMATGTGKTYTAFQIVWKLVKSGYFKKVLFVADRKFLRDQAHDKDFSPFGDARDIIIEGKAPKVRDVCFTTYQSLFSGDENKRLYQEYPPDFFDLVIIDECHRSGWKDWHVILKHFSNAVHFGMTATPKRDDNIDTYAYFGNPVYEYNITQGIEDGYLANYLVQRIFTNLDKAGGISLKEARMKGAEIYYPEEDPEIVIKDYYNAAEFEKAITIPDRTKKICQHLAKLLETFGPMDKTIVYCVNTDHAQDVKKELQKHFAHLGHSNYAVRIVAEDEEARKHYEIFKDSEKAVPVVATTVDLLTTGVDIPSVKNIVFLRTVSSVVLFNQMIGRGTRIDEASNKYYFRIIDYTGATRLFEKLLPPPPTPTSGKPEPSDYFLKGQVFDAETQLPIEDAKVIVIPRPNEQIRAKTDREGFFFLDKLPRHLVTLVLSKVGYTRRESKKQSVPVPTEIFSIALHKSKEAKPPIVIDNIPVHIETEEEFLIETGKRLLKKAEYIEYSREGIKKKAVSLNDLLKIWLDDERRSQFLGELLSINISPDVISSVIFRRSDIDPFDILAHVAFDAPVISRDERAQALLTIKQMFIQSFPQDAREIILDLIDQYRIGGIEDLKPEVFKLHHFVHKYGSPQNIIQRLRTRELQHIFNKLKTNIYSQYYG